MEEDSSLGTVLSVKECKTLRSLAVADVGKKTGVGGILVCFNLHWFVQTGLYRICSSISIRMTEI